MLVWNSDQAGKTLCPNAFYKANDLLKKCPSIEMRNEHERSETTGMLSSQYMELCFHGMSRCFRNVDHRAKSLMMMHNY